MLFLNSRKRKGMTREEADAIINKSKTEAPLELEKGDLPAILMAAFIVFVPFLLAFGAAFGIVWWLMFRVIGG